MFRSQPHVQHSAESRRKYSSRATAESPSGENRDDLTGDAAGARERCADAVPATERCGALVRGRIVQSAAANTSA